MEHRNAPPSPVSPLQDSVPMVPLNTQHSAPTPGPPTTRAPTPPTAPAQNPPSAPAPNLPTVPTSPNTARIQSASSVRPQTVPANNPPQVSTRSDWLPFTLRWYFLILPILVSLGFGIALAYLCWYSRHNYGLGADDGSSAILFGWRFTPTLLVVIYTQITVILFEDVKRTEPFARLANAPAGGASAYGTLLQTPRSWWAILVDVTYKRKTVGKTGYSLICIAIVNVLALLAISPLSSALLTSEEVIVPKSIDFTRLSPSNGSQIPMKGDRETYFRTMVALTREFPTSAWVTDNSLTFPFWPSSEKAQLGPEIASSHGSWQMETTTYSAGFGCKNMTLESAQLQNRTYTAPDWHGFMYNGSQPMVSYVLTSDEGCRYELDVHPLVDIAYNGGVTWSNASTYNPVYADAEMGVDGLVIHANVSAKSPYARVRASSECNSREIIIMSTPWTAPLYVTPGSLRMNPSSYKKSSSFRMQALLCESHFTMTQGALTASITSGTSTTLENTPGNAATSEQLAVAHVDIPGFQNLSLSNQWRLYLDDTKVPDNTVPTQANNHTAPQTPGFSGPGAMLAAMSAFNLTSMMDNPNLVAQAERVKGRFFAEVLRDSLVSPYVQDESTSGLVTMVEARVIVLQEVGITLAVLFLTSFCLLVALLWSSRLRWRPLQLQSDPGSTVGMGILLDPRLTTMSTLRRMHNASKRDLKNVLRQETFLTTSSTLYEGGSTSTGRSPKKDKAKRNWRPRAIHLRNLLALAFFLSLVLIAVLVLNAFASGSRLHQKAFVYQADLSKYGLSISSFAPISIAPTVISIITGLWWDQVDMTFRILQPYISMSKEPTPICRGAGLTYRSKTWMGAAVKAARNKHWVLFVIALGSTLCQVLTVSMSALFEMQHHNDIRQVSVNRSLEVRQVPIITNIDTDDQRVDAFRAINPLYQDAASNWLYGATIGLSLNGSQPAWSRDEWSFVPIDLSYVPGSASIQPMQNESTVDNFVAPTNVTAVTSAIRASLDCRPIEQIANTSSWLLKMTADEREQANFTGPNGYELTQWLFSGTNSSTTMFANSAAIRCCTNDSTNSTTSGPQNSVIGYWSPIVPKDTVEGFPYEGRQWPMSFVTKWLHGKPTKVLDFPGYSDVSGILYYEEQPSIQAAHCSPALEETEAVVSVDKTTGVIHSYELHGVPTTIGSAWSDVFVRHNISDSGEHYNSNYTGRLNVTTSFGIMFLDGLFGAADRRSATSSAGAGDTEDVDENSFNIRDQAAGLNMDLMTYSMYALANKDPQALLNYTVLVGNANRTFQTFFQYFAANKLSLTEGSWTYQTINDSSMETLGRPVNENGTAIPGRSYPTLNTERTVTASVSNRIQILHLNSAATYLSAAILIWLIGTTVIISCLQRRYTSSMIRNVEVMADVLVLVAGSDNFLKLVQDKGVALKKDRNIKTMLGWFKGRDGEIRWGVEVVGGRNAVEWVDAPKQQRAQP